MAKKKKVSDSMRQNRNYSEEDLFNAVEATKNRHLTYGKAARIYNVPKPTIYKYVKGGFSSLRQIGHQTYMSYEEELSLANYMRWMEEKHVPFTYEILKTFASELLKLKYNTVPDLGQKWLRAFAKRHRFSPRKAREKEAAKNVAAASAELITDYFKLLEAEIESLNISPNTIWNMDEKGWSKQQALQRPVLCTVGKKQACTRQIFASEHITSVHCANAMGDILSRTMVIFSKNIPTTIETNDLPRDWLYYTTESGYMNSESMLYWFENAFLPSIGRERPQLLIFDAASSHYSLDLVKRAKTENISIISLPGKTTSFLQPLDQMFSPLINSFSNLAYKLSFTKLDFLVRPRNFPQVLSQSLKTAWPREIVSNAFKITGMFPPNIDEALKSPHITETCKLKVAKILANSAVEPETIAQVVLEDDVAPLTSPTEPYLCPECERSEACKTCMLNEKKKTNVLYKAGLIEEKHLDILDPPLIPTPTCKPRLTKAKHLTGHEIIQDLEAKEKSKLEKEKRKQNASKKKQKSPNSITEDISGLENENDNFPQINPPKRLREKRNSTPINNDIIVESVSVIDDIHNNSTVLLPDNSGARRSSRHTSRPNYVAMDEGSSMSEMMKSATSKKTKKNIVKCPSCNVLYHPSDNLSGVIWYGCDICTRWYHRDCLDPKARADADLSCMLGDVLFRCPSCPLYKTCSVCFINGESGFITCDNCSSFIHSDCLPHELYQEYQVFKQLNKKWFCSRCEVED